MQRRAVGQTGLKVSRLGLGTWLWGLQVDEHEARDQLTAYVEAGGNLVDTAVGDRFVFTVAYHGVPAIKRWNAPLMIETREGATAAGMARDADKHER